ncbi:MAG: beta-phosphoglucomutase [Sphingomonadales bacterium]
MIFDLDGVLTDTAVHHYQSWRRIAEGVGFALTEKHNEQLKGVSRADSLDIILGWADATLNDAEKAALLIEKNNHYFELIASLSSADILPGVVAFLENIRSGGIKTAVGSSSKNAPFILDKLQLTSYFDAVVDGNMVRQTKPDPEVFINAAKLLALPAESCLVIEDADAGVAAARAAGMSVLGITAHGQLAEADFCVQNLLNIDLSFLQSQFS